MPVDGSIYFQQQTPDFLGQFQRGLSMRDMLDQKARVKGIDDAYKAGTVTGPDGKMTFDGQKTLSSLAGQGYGKEAMEFGTKLQEQDAAKAKFDREKKKEQIELTGRLLGSVNSQESWDKARVIAQQNGIPIDNLPTAYDPQLVSLLSAQNLSVKEQHDLENSKADGVRKDKELTIKEKELAIKGMEARNKAVSGEKLPLDKKKFVETMSMKNANKAGIKNQIDAVVSQWDKLSEDQKVAMGGQLLKTLNSPEGADAVGAEEAKRLGSKLQFAMGNFTNGNPTQFGRDLEGFKLQAQNTSANLGSALEMNQKQIDEAMGRSEQVATKKDTPPKQEADVAKYAKAHGITYEEAQRVKMQRTTKQAGL